MHSLTEYHGWVALTSHRQDWTDTDWDNALLKVQDTIAGFTPENGHSIQFSEEHANTIHAVLLSGHTEDNVESVVQLMRFIGQILPDSYGELVILEECSPNLTSASRYRLENGSVSKL